MLVDYFLILFMFRRCMFSVCHVLPRKPCFSPLLSSSRSARQDTPCLSLSTRLMSCQCLYYPTVCLHSRCHARLKKRCGSEREVFCARFATFCRAFQNTFYPMLAHFLTLSMAWFLPLRGGWGGVRWHAPHIAAPPPVPWHAMQLHCASQKLTSPKWSANE